MLVWGCQSPSPLSAGFRAAVEVWTPLSETGSGQQNAARVSVMIQRSSLHLQHRPLRVLPLTWKGAQRPLEKSSDLGCGRATDERGLQLPGCDLGEPLRCRGVSVSGTSTTLDRYRVGLSNKHSVFNQHAFNFKLKLYDRNNPGIFKRIITITSQLWAWGFITVYSLRQCTKHL